MIGDLAVRAEGQRVSRECHGARMDYEEIIDKTGDAAGGLDREAAEHALQATLQTLAERLPRGEARHIMRELPPELIPWIYTQTDAAAFGIDEFLEQVATREGTDIETALRHARGVFFVLGDALSPEAVAHLAASLPQTFDPLVAEAQRRDLELMPVGQFWARVAAHLGIDQAAARRITEAVLQTLAERIAKGQVEDLMAQLDPLLHPPQASVARCVGRAPEGGACRSRSSCAGWPRGRERDVAEANLFEEIAGHVRAVLATLAEAISSKDWFDVTVELPEDYGGLIPARSG